MQRNLRMLDVTAKEPVKTSDQHGPGDNGPHGLRTGVQEVHASTNRHQVGGDVEGVGHDKQGDQEADDDAPPLGESNSNQLSEVLATRQSRSVADLLDRRHEGKRQQGHPKHRESESRAGLGVGGNARRVVVGRTGDETGAET